MMCSSLVSRQAFHSMEYRESGDDSKSFALPLQFVRLL